MLSSFGDLSLTSLEKAKVKDAEIRRLAAQGNLPGVILLYCIPIILLSMLPVIITLADLAETSTIFLNVDLNVGVSSFTSRPFLVHN